MIWFSMIETTYKSDVIKVVQQIGMIR